MGQSRTLGAVRSYFSKNRKRLDFDRVADEAQARIGGADGIPMQQVCLQDIFLLLLHACRASQQRDSALAVMILVLLVRVKYLCSTLPVSVDADRRAAEPLSIYSNVGSLPRLVSNV